MININFLLKFYPFKNKMKFLIYFLLLTMNSYSQNIEINCSNNQCNSTELVNADSSCSLISNKNQCEAKVLGNYCQWVDSNNSNGGSCTSYAQSKNCSGYNCPAGQTMSLIKIRGLLDLDLNVLTNTMGTPQNLGLVTNSGQFPGKNINVSINSQNDTSNGANLILIGDNINNLNVNLDGYNGERGKHSSEICADKVKNGDYGSNIQNYFNNRRSSNSTLDPNRCDADDLNYMQTFNFSCDDPAYQEISTSNPVVSVSQVKKLARCNAVASYSYCVKRKLNVSCNFKLWSTFRQQWVTGDILDSPSWYPGPQSCTDSYTSCGNTNIQCTNYQVTQVTPLSNNNNGTFSFNQCKYNSAQNNPCASQQVGSILNIETFYKTTSCASNQIPGMPVTRSISAGPFEEEFFNSEMTRLGGIDKFCEAYAPIPPKSVSQDWWSGIGGAPGSAMAIINGTNTETTGIPWEKMGVINRVASDGSYIGENYEPAGVSPNWKQETRSQYEPVVQYATNYITYPTPPYNGTQQWTWKTRSAIWKGNGSTYNYTSPGLNPDGISLTPGSNWQITQTNTFENCPPGWSNLKNIFLNLVQYTNKENTSCAGITDPQDPNNRAFWQYTGLSQESTFGTESVSCSIGSCAVNSTVSELARSVDTIIPGNGENGTEQGRGILFVYDIKNINTRSLPGSSGVVGNTDININPQERICVKIDDANAGINTEQAKNPFVSFRRYQWQAIKSTSGANPGTPPRNTGKGIEIFKKLDPATRFFLDKNLL